MSISSSVRRTPVSDDGQHTNAINYTQEPPKPPLQFHPSLSTPALSGIPRATIYRVCRHSICCRQCSQRRGMETPSNLLAHFTLGTNQGLGTGLVLSQWF